MKKKMRLDKRVLSEHPEYSRNYIQSIIMQGKVLVDDQVESKPGTLVSDEVTIALRDAEQKYASRAGFKLEKALDYFGIDVAGMTVLDSGISTGGFSDCMLQRGVARIYGVDVGVGQVHEKILKDKRLTLFEKTNLRYLESLPSKVDLATLDLSFISLLKVMPAVANLIKPGGSIVALIKPQFEADKKDIGKGGVVKSDAVHKQIIEKIKEGMKEFGFTMVDVIESPIRGAAKGNKEFLALFQFKKAVETQKK